MPPRARAHPPAGAVPRLADALAVAVAPDRDGGHGGDRRLVDVRPGTLTLPDAQATPDALAEAFLPLALASARRLRERFPRWYRDPDDARSDAMLALALAVGSWEPTGGAAFDTWYGWQLRGVVAAAARVATAEKRAAPPTWHIEAAAVDPDRDLDLADPGSGDDIEAVDARDAAAPILAAIAALPPRYAEVVTRMAVAGESGQAVAEAMGVTRSAAYQLYDAARARLRAALAAAGPRRPCPPSPPPRRAPPSPASPAPAPRRSARRPGRGTAAG